MCTLIKIKSEAPRVGLILQEVKKSSNLLGRIRHKKSVISVL